MGGGGSKSLNELSTYELTRNLNIKDILLSDKFKYYFYNSTYLTDGTGNKGSSDPNYYIQYQCGEPFDAPAKKYLYDCFLNNFKTQIEDPNGFISFNNIIGLFTDANFLLGSNFDASKYNDYHDLQINEIGGAVNNLYGSGAWDSSSPNYKYVYKFSSSEIGNNLKLYYGRMILKGILEDSDLSRFRGYTRFVYNLINCLKFCGYDAFNKTTDKIMNGLKWSTVIPEKFTGDESNSGIGLIQVTKYIC